MRQTQKKDKNVEPERKIAKFDVWAGESTLFLTLGVISVLRRVYETNRILNACHFEFWTIKVQNLRDEIIRANETRCVWITANTTWKCVNIARK